MARELRNLKSQYDVIVIGAGLGGLTAANRLARLGHSVLILEHHTMIGGLAAWFKRKGHILLQFKMLAFTGESRPDTAHRLRYCAADVEVRNHRKLNALILEHGFPHHLAVVMGDISQELNWLCDFYGIAYISPDTD